MESDILGYVGGFIISITLIPQLIKTYKTKRAHDISPLFVILAFLTTLIYLSYGILINETPIIAANSVLLFQNFLLLYFKYIYMPLSCCYIAIIILHPMTTKKMK